MGVEVTLQIFYFYFFGPFIIIQEIIENSRKSNGYDMSILIHGCDDLATCLYGSNSIGNLYEKGGGSDS